MKAIHLVLDTSAILACAEGSSDVGEPLTQVAENDAASTVPLTVLATAAAATEHSMLRLLTRHPAFEPVDLEWTRWPALAAAFGLLGRLDAAGALLFALDHECHVLTAEPGLYAALGDDPPIIST